MAEASLTAISMIFELKILFLVNILEVNMSILHMSKNLLTVLKIGPS